MKMSKEKTDIPPVATGIFTLPPYDKSPPRLRGGFCSKCNKYYFPRPGYCRFCLEPIEEKDLGSRGVIYSYTVIRTKAPLGLPTPYSVGYIDLSGSSLRIFCLLDPAAIEQLQVGLKVRLAVGPLGHDGHGAPCLRPYFIPQKLE
jgi:uncharacterized OB-fold protein